MAVISVPWRQQGGAWHDVASRAGGGNAIEKPRPPNGHPPHCRLPGARPQARCPVASPKASESAVVVTGRGETSGFARGGGHDCPAGGAQRRAAPRLQRLQGSRRTRLRPHAPVRRPGGQQRAHGRQRQRRSVWVWGGRPGCGLPGKPGPGLPGLQPAGAAGGSTAATLRALLHARTEAVGRGCAPAAPEPARPAPPPRGPRAPRAPPPVPAPAPGPRSTTGRTAA